jgi:hypothetical protein
MLRLAGVAQLRLVLPQALDDSTSTGLDVLAELLDIGLAGFRGGLELLPHLLDVRLALGRDLILLVAEAAHDAAMPGLCARTQALHIRLAGSA